MLIQLPDQLFVREEFQARNKLAEVSAKKDVHHCKYYIFVGYPVCFLRHSALQRSTADGPDSIPSGSGGGGGRFPAADISRDENIRAGPHDATRSEGRGAKDIP
jgi:hypothetical protein